MLSIVYIILIPTDDYYIISNLLPRLVLTKPRLYFTGPTAFV